MTYDRAVTDDPLSEDQVLLGMLGSGGQLLELGCNTGYFSAALQRQGFAVRAVDLDEAAVSQAVDRGIDASVLDVEQPGALETLDGPYDVILMANILEHLRDPQGVLTAVADLLRPDGRLFVSVPNVAHISVRRSLLRGRFDYADSGILDATHLHFFTRATLRTLLEGAGWHVTREAISPGILAPTLKCQFIRRLTPHVPNLLAAHLIAEATPQRRAPPPRA